MGKTSVIIIYITLAILLLLLLVSNNPHHRHHHRGRRLKLRSNFNFTTGNHNNHSSTTFDPLVAEILRKREDRQWEEHHHHDEWEDFDDAEDYLNDEERFNVTNRLVMLFPQIDVDPVDGYVSEAELTRWNLQQSQREVLHRSRWDMELHDRNKDGFVSFAEYEAPGWAKNSDNYSFGYNIGWWKEGHFNASDADGDGLLNITEFNDFLHPADSSNPNLLQWLCTEEIRERDSDGDGKLNFKEFFHGLFDLVRDYDDQGHNYPHQSDDSDEASARMLFAQLDKDSDGYVSDLELLPIIEKLHPSERYYAKQQSEYMMQQADTNKDGLLTLAEMTESPYSFYSSVFNEDEDGDYDYHDEFR